MFMDSSKLTSLSESLLAPLLLPPVHMLSENVTCFLDAETESLLCESLLCDIIVMARPSMKCENAAVLPELFNTFVIIIGDVLSRFIIGRGFERSFFDGLRVTVFSL